MKCLVAFLVALSVAVAGNCGTYKTSCYTDLSGRSMSTAYVSCGMNGYVSKIQVDYTRYTDECKTEFYTLGYTYKTTKKSDATDKNNAQYNSTISKITFKAKNADKMNSDYKCSPTIVKNKKYDINDFTCKSLLVDIFAAYKSYVGKQQTMSIAFDNNQITIVGGLTVLPGVKSNSFWGCWQWWSIILLVVVIIIVIVAIVLPFCLKGKKSEIPKKASK